SLLCCSSPASLDTSSLSLHDALPILFERLVRVLADEAPGRLAVPFPAAELYERLVPYRSNRSALKVATHQDYEMAVLRLLAGERGYVALDPTEVREALQREAAEANPDTALFRQFPDAILSLNRLAAERFLRGDRAYAPPAPARPESLDDADREEAEEEPAAAIAPVLERAAAQHRFGLDLERLPYCADHYLKTKETLPDHAFRHLRDDVDAILLGALGDPRVPGNEHARDILLGLRFRLDLYINFRPVQLLHPDLTPLRSDRPIDFVVFRENTEGVYLGRGHIDQDEYVAEDVNTTKGVERIIRAAFQWA